MAGRRHRAGAAMAVALTAVAGACEPVPPPTVGVSTSARYLEAARLAMEDVEGGGPSPVDTLMIPEIDNRSEPAVQAADRFASLPGILAVVGHSNSAASLAASQIYNEHGVVQIAPQSSAVVYSRAGPWSFRLVPPDDAQAAFLAEQVDTLFPEGERLAVLYVNDDYGRGLLADFTAALDRDRHTVVLEYPHTEEEALLPDVIEATTGAVVNAEPGAILWLGRASALHAYLPSFGDRLPDTPILGGDAVASALQYPNRDGRWNGVMYVDFVDLRANPSIRSFARRFEERVGLPASGPDALTYDAMALVLAAVREGARTPEDLRAYLTSLGRERPAFEGITGLIRFDDEGDVERGHVLGMVGGGA